MKYLKNIKRKNNNYPISKITLRRIILFSTLLGISGICAITTSTLLGVACNYTIVTKDLYVEYNEWFDPTYKWVDKTYKVGCINYYYDNKNGDYYERVLYAKLNINKELKELEEFYKKNPNYIGNIYDPYDRLYKLQSPYDIDNGLLTSYNMMVPAAFIFPFSAIAFLLNLSPFIKIWKCYYLEKKIIKYTKNSITKEID